MSLYVAKFGGSSIATPVRIERVCRIISRLISAGHRIVVVTSAMQGITNQLIELTRSFGSCAFDREYDAVISSGEQVAAGLLAICLCSIGFKAKSLNAWQVPIGVNGEFSNATICSVEGQTIINILNDGIIPIITGFQGISDKMDICTIGRGGSDATACAVAKTIDADECLIYTDVNGVYSADPRIVLPAKRLSEVAYDDMLALADGGAAVLQAKSILIAKEHNVKLRVLSSFSKNGETRVTEQTNYVSIRHKVAGIAHNFALSIVAFNDDSAISKVINHLQHVDLIQIERSNFFLLPKSQQCELEKFLNKSRIPSKIDNDVGVITIVVGWQEEMSTLLEEIITKITGCHNQIKCVFSRDNSISVVLPFQQTYDALNVLHRHFFGQ
ncbi:MAG: hypothetical protein LBB34_02660 [Holosporales bacterium]|jgi:aspartate kinase|nr:hypothetical protein [Holosporales bacterium]